MKGQNTMTRTATMNRSNLLIALIVGMLLALTLSNVHASGMQVEGHVLDFDAESNTFVVIVSIDNEYVRGITVTADHQMTEDALSDNDTDTFVGTLDDTTLTVNDTTYLYTTINNPVVVSGNTINGVAVQFHNPVQDGAATIIRSADAYSVNGLGYLIQDNTVITFAAYNGEVQHTIYMPLVQN